MPHFLRWSFVGNNSSQKQEKIPSHDISTTDETNPPGFTHKSWPARHLWTSEKEVLSHFGQQKYIKIHTVQYCHRLWGQVVVCLIFIDIPRSNKKGQKDPLSPLWCFDIYIYMDYICFFFYVCLCVVMVCGIFKHLGSWGSSKPVTANVKSLTGTWRGMRHGQQLQLVIGLEGARMSRLATKRHSITRWSPLLQIKHCIKSRCHLSCHVIHVMNICIQLLSPKTSFKKPKLRQLNITVHSVQRCFVRVLRSGTYL